MKTGDKVKFKIGNNWHKGEIYEIISTGIDILKEGVLYFVWEDEIKDKIKPLNP